MPGVKLKSFGTAIVVAIVLGILNAFVYPILAFFSLPITIITLGLFLFILNTIIILLCSWLVRNFEVSGFWSAMFYSIVLSAITWVVNIIFQSNQQFL